MGKRSRSPSESSDEELKRKKKKKKKSKKKEKDLANTAVLESLGVSPITEDDYFPKHYEFRNWLFEKHLTYFDRLTTKQALKKFKKFMKKWNKGKLNPKFYKKRTAQSLDGAERTGYTWAFEKKISKQEKMEMQCARDSVDNYTNEDKLVSTIASILRASKRCKCCKPTSCILATPTPQHKEQWDKRREIKTKQKERREKKHKEETDGLVDFEKREHNKYDRQARKKKWQRMDKVVQEELIPKKEGFARRVEKRQAKHRQMNRVNDNDSFDHFGSRDQGLDFYKRKRNDKRRADYGREKRAYRKDRNFQNMFG